MVLTSFIEGLHDAQLRWELLKSKPASPDAALALAVELHAFMEMDPSLGNGSQATVNMVSATPPQPLMAITSTSQDDMMGTLKQTIRQEIQKALSQKSHSSRSRSSSTDGRSVRFNSPGPNRQRANTNQNQNQNYRNSNNNNRYNNNQNNRYNTVAISKTTDTTIIAIHQTSNKTETTQINNHVGNATEQITSPGIVKLVLVAEDWDICLANVEHHEKIKTIGNRIRMLNKIHEISIKTATQIPHSNRIL